MQDWMLNEIIEGAGKPRDRKSLGVLISKIYERATTHWNDERARLMFDVGLLLLVSQ